MILELSSGATKLMQKNSSIVGTKQMIGKQTAANYGKDIARIIGLPNPDSYTGQCWRGTSATYCADGGMTELEIMNVTGHKSAKSARVYIDNSRSSKRKASSILAIDGAPQIATPRPQSALPKNKKPRSVNITINMQHVSNPNFKVVTAEEDGHVTE